MNFVLLTAVLSAANSGIYATSRTLYSMAKTGVAPKRLAKISKTGIPLVGILIATLCILIGVFLAYISPDQVISYLMTIPGFTIMLIWIGICAAQLKLRPQYKQQPTFRVKWFPFTTSFAILALSMIFIGFMLSSNNLIGSSVCLITVAILVILSFVVKNNRTAIK
jgi:AAT family amino acid transporter